jgi:5-methyltetrahydrofolate--homocysteine methyltransferase
MWVLPRTPEQGEVFGMTLKEALKQNPLLVSDGGIGTQLQQLGLEPGGCGDEWNVTHTEQVATVHRNYVRAGSQLITTNTFGSNRFVLANYGLEEKQREIATTGARIAKQAVDSSRWVMGSVGPCGGFLQPLGEIDPAELERSLRVQIAALLEGGADAILVETMTALDELEMSVRVARELGAPLIIASCAFDKTKAGPRTMMGATPEQAIRTAIEAGADVVGANCGTIADVEDFVDLVRRMRAVTDLPLILQPNGGQPTLEGDRIVYHISPAEMAVRLARLSTEVNIIGGCCGTAPAHIQALNTLIHASNKKVGIASSDLD